jgi:hypothetical protein
LIYAFAPHSASAPESSPERRNQLSVEQLPAAASPSKSTRGAMNIVEVKSDSSDSDDN